MKCEDLRARIQEKLDGELASADDDGMDRHLATCSACAQVWNDLTTLRRILSQPAAMPQPLARTVWRKLDRRAKRGWTAFLGEGWRRLTGYLRDIDRTVLWARLSAFPVTIAAVLLLLPFVPQSDLEKWTYQVAARHVSAESLQGPVMVDVVQSRNEFRGLVETAWKIPYEDSLWLVADIQPEGNAQIGDVIEYPKNLQLLEAVDHTLRHSRFDVADNLENPQFIYGFQKVDVYENIGRVF